MDYPKSVPNVGLVDGKFIDENTVTGAVGSLIPSVWGNAVTDEILAVIKAAGIVPSEGATDQLLKAIRGSSLFVTQPQFTATKEVATTEFVQRAAGSLAGYVNYAASTTLTAADVGKYVYTSGPTVTLTLPDAALLPAGSRLYVQAGASTICTVKSINGNVSGPNGNSAGSPNVVLAPGVAAEFISSGLGWLSVGGSGFAVLADYGYQSFPGGLIMQWGMGTSNASGVASVSFPVKFPNACRRLVTTPRNVAAYNSTASVGAYTAQNFTAYTTLSASGQAGLAQALSFEWLAIGN